MNQPVLSISHVKTYLSYQHSLRNFARWRTHSLHWQTVVTDSRVSLERGAYSCRDLRSITDITLCRVHVYMPRGRGLLMYCEPTWPVLNIRDSRMQKSLLPISIGEIVVCSARSVELTTRIPCVIFFYHRENCIRISRVVKLGEVRIHLSTCGSKSTVWTHFCKITAFNRLDFPSGYQLYET